MPDRAVLACRIHGLEHQKDGMAVGCVEKLLLGTETRDMVCQQFLVLLLRFVNRIDHRRPFLEVDIVSFLHTKLF